MICPNCKQPLTYLSFRSDAWGRGTVTIDEGGEVERTYKERIDDTSYICPHCLQPFEPDENISWRECD